MEKIQICTLLMNNKYLSDKTNIINFLKSQGYIVEEDKINNSNISVYIEENDNRTIYGYDVSHKKNNTNIIGHHMMIADNGDCYCPNCKSLLGNIDDIKSRKQPIQIEYETNYDYFCDNCGNYLFNP